MHGGCDAAQDRAWTDVEWFIRDGTHWRRRHEHVEEVCWTRSEICTALAKAGFHRIRALDAARFFQDNPFIRPGHRTFFLARKS